MQVQLQPHCARVPAMRHRRLGKQYSAALETNSSRGASNCPGRQEEVQEFDRFRNSSQVEILGYLQEAAFGLRRGRLASRARPRQGPRRPCARSSPGCWPTWTASRRLTCPRLSAVHLAFHKMGRASVLPAARSLGQAATSRNGRPSPPPLAVAVVSAVLQMLPTVNWNCPVPDAVAHRPLPPAT